MKLRNVIAAAAAIGALVPVSARATHCDTPIYLFSTTRIQTDVEDPTSPGNTIGRGVPAAVSSAVGCTVVRDTVIGTEDPMLHPATETDLIYPGANRMSVRLLDQGNDPTIVASATLVFAGNTYALNLQKSVDITGAAAPWLDSQNIVIDPANTFTGNTAKIDICLTDGECFSRTYKTAG